MIGRLYAIAALLALTAAGLLAQGDRGIITGTVKDPSGAAMPGRLVTAIQLATNTSYKTSTTASGDFTVPSLPVGDYQVRVENTGFKTQVENNVVVAAGATVRLDVAMEVGATQQTMEVEANAAILQTEAGRVSHGGLAKLVDESAAGRQRRGAQPLRPGRYHGGSRRQRDSNFRIGGGRIGVFGMTLDGTADHGRTARMRRVSWAQINAPSVEALTEFSVESGGFKAEIGHASGGTISFVSKSGTNDISRRRLRVPAQPETGRAGLFRGHEVRIQTERFRRDRGRSGVQFPKYTTAATGHSSSSPTRASAIA